MNPRQREAVTLLPLWKPYAVQTPPLHLSRLLLHQMDSIKKARTVSTFPHTYTGFADPQLTMAVRCRMTVRTETTACPVRHMSTVYRHRVTTTKLSVLLAVISCYRMRAMLYIATPVLTCVVVTFHVARKQFRNRLLESTVRGVVRVTTPHAATSDTSAMKCKATALQPARVDTPRVIFRSFPRQTPRPPHGYVPR